jgi:hypothetical protein
MAVTSGDYVGWIANMGGKLGTELNILDLPRRL